MDDEVVDEAEDEVDELDEADDCCCCCCWLPVLTATPAMVSNELCCCCCCWYCINILHAPIYLIKLTTKNTDETATRGRRNHNGRRRWWWWRHQMTSTITHEGLNNNWRWIRRGVRVLSVYVWSVCGGAHSRGPTDDPDVACVRVCVCVSHRVTGRRQWRHMDIHFILCSRVESTASRLE